MVAEHESDLRDTEDWRRKWLVDFNSRKTQLAFFDQSNNIGAIDVKMDGSFLEEKSSFKMLGLYFSSKFDWGSHIISIAKTVFKIIEPLIRFINFFLLRLLCIFISLPYDLAWNAVVMSGLTVLTATWKC